MRLMMKYWKEGRKKERKRERKNMNADASNECGRRFSDVLEKKKSQ